MGVFEVECWIKDDIFLNHFFFNNFFAWHIDLFIAIGLRGCRHTDFNLGLNCGEYLFRLFGILAAKHVLLVNHKYDRYAVIVLCAAGNIIERSRVFGFAHHQILILVDALPVHKKNFSRLDIAVGGVVEFIVDYGTEGAILSKVVFHLEVALLMQLIWSNPDISHFGARGIGTLCEFMIEPHKHFRSHHCFA